MQALAATPPHGAIVLHRRVWLVGDLKTAAVLAGSTGLLGAITVPFLLPSAFELVPPDQRTLPLPLPLFSGTGETS